MYIATAFIGTDYTPGEILPDDLDEALVKRLLKSGAIREAAPEPAAQRPAKAEAPAQEPEKPAAPEEPEDETKEAEEPYEEPEAPEVDAAEALIAPAEEEAKPAPRKRTAKGGKGK